MELISEFDRVRKRQLRGQIPTAITIVNNKLSVKTPNKLNIKQFNKFISPFWFKT